MRFLIFGATGQDGRVLSSLLSDDKYSEVIAVSRATSERNASHSHVRNICLDNYDVDSISSLFAQFSPDIVVNLIGQSSVGSSFYCKDETNFANLQIPKNICTALEAYPSIFLFHASSAYIFDCSTPIGFQSRTVTFSPYAQSKASIYSYMLSRESLRGRSCIFHFFNHVSEFSDHRFLLPSLASIFMNTSSDHVDIKVGSMLAVRNWGLSRDYMNVLKTISQMRPSDRRSEYFVGSNLNLSVLEVIESMAAILNKSYSIKCDDSKLRPHDPLRVEIEPALLSSQGLDMPSYSKNYFVERLLEMFAHPCLLTQQDSER